MDAAIHLDHLAVEGELLAKAAERAGLDAPVPTCPDWTVRDLVRHTGAVHEWATSIVSTPRTEAWDVGLDEVVGAWPPDPELVAWFRAGHARLVGALRDADPTLKCFTFLQAPSPLAMWTRRQAHETAIHRVDAELAGTGAVVSPLDAAFAADGIDELLACFITRGSKRLSVDKPQALRVRTTDTGDVWDVTFQTGPVATVHNGLSGYVDATIDGTAAELYLALWSRHDPSGLPFSGDPATLSHFLDNVHIRW